MNENSYTHMIADLAEQIKTKTLESAEYRARLAQETQERTRIEQELAFIRQVLDSDDALKELFDEQAKKLETQEV